MTAIKDGIIIRKIREEKGISRARLSEMVGLDVNRMQQYENGARNPKTALLNQIYKALGVYVKYDMKVEVYYDSKPKEFCEIKDIFKERLKELREKNNMSQEELAKLTELPKSKIIAFEEGSEEPTLSIIAKIAQALDVSIDHLCKYDKENNPAETIYESFRVVNMH